mmetsp:Transcript_2114/g.4685  ORF Transcript_2114/g.4685 Transcript_2114/m.4685 type:complete len:125 (+) Transcript_2114:36-410(+)
MTLPRRGNLPIGFGGLGSSSSSGPTDTTLLLLTSIALLSLSFLFFVFRPRTKGGKAGPPVVTSSPVCGLPVIGTIVEFGKSPVKMVQRCYEEYGPVFTVPVSFCLLDTALLAGEKNGPMATSDF